MGFPAPMTHNLLLLHLQETQCLFPSWALTHLAYTRYTHIRMIKKITVRGYRDGTEVKTTGCSSHMAVHNCL